MSSAIIRGMVKSGAFEKEQILGCNRRRFKTDALMEECGIVGYDSAEALVKDADVVILGVKPQMLDGVLAGIRPFVGDKLVISIAAGKSISYYKEKLGADVRIVRTMPNVGAKVLASVTGLCADGGETDAAVARRIFETVGTVVELPEHFFSIFSAIAGCSGAYVFAYINELSRAAVRAGMPKPMALEIAAGATLGAAKLAFESKEHPEALIDQVCSPGGTTIEAVCALAENGFAHAIHSAVAATIEKDKKL